MGNEGDEVTRFLCGYHTQEVHPSPEKERDAVGCVPDPWLIT